MAKPSIKRSTLFKNRAATTALTAALSMASYCIAMPTVSAEPSFTANLGITSNYVFRGQTQSDDGIAVQGGVDYTHETEFYVGAWGSTVDAKNNGNGGGLEIDLYAGWAHSWDDFGIDIGYITYEYTDSNFSEGASEIYVGFDWGPAGITYYEGSDDNPGASDYNYIDVGLDIEMVDDVLLSFHFGRLSPDTGSSTNDFKVEASKNILDFDVSLALTYEDNADPKKETELFLTVKKSFDL